MGTGHLVAAGATTLCLSAAAAAIYFKMNKFAHCDSKSRDMPRRRKMRKLLLARPPSSLSLDESTELSHSSDFQTWAAFVCHCKTDCAMVARVLQNELEDFLGQPVFLDSDDLLDLRMLKTYVRRSNVLVLCLSANVFSRPYCLLEVLAAIDANVPVITLELTEGPNAYEHAYARSLLPNLPHRLDMECASVLRSQGVSLREAAVKLTAVVLHAPTVKLNQFRPAPNLVELFGQLAEIARTARSTPVPAIKLAECRKYRRESLTLMPDGSYGPAVDVMPSMFFNSRGDDATDSSSTTPVPSAFSGEASADTLSSSDSSSSIDSHAEC